MTLHSTILQVLDRMEYMFGNNYKYELVFCIFIGFMEEIEFDILLMGNRQSKSKEMIFSGLSISLCIYMTWHEHSFVRYLLHFLHIEIKCHRQ